MTAKAHSALISTGARVRKSPYFDVTLRAGAKAFTVYNHTYMLTLYADPVSEYGSLVNDVTVWDVGCERQIEITGPDALELVQFLTPRHISKCQVGQCQYVVMTDEDGDDPARWHRLFWAVALAVVPVTLMFIGRFSGDPRAGLTVIQTATLVVSLPILIVGVLMSVSLLKQLREDHESALEVRTKT
jgi:hypothetical protein